MNKEIINEIAININVKDSQVEAVLKLLEEGSTIPFIARYRKEATGALDEEQIRSINEVYEYQVNLLISDQQQTVSIFHHFHQRKEHIFLSF